GFAQVLQGDGYQQQGFAFYVDDAAAVSQVGIGGATDIHQQRDGDIAPLAALLLVERLGQGQSGPHVGAGFGVGIDVYLVAVQAAPQPDAVGLQHFEAAANGVQHVWVACE